MSTLEGKLVANNMKVGIVVARFNEFITNKLLGGAMDGLLRHDVKEEDITVAWVPAAEIPEVPEETTAEIEEADGGVPPVRDAGGREPVLAGGVRCAARVSGERGRNALGLAGLA